MINLINVTKQYGNIKALDNLSIDIKENGIYCLLGRNGAGKTTLMKLMSGYIGATSGHVKVNGKNVSPSQMPKCLSFVENHHDHFNMRIKSIIEISSTLQEDFNKEFAHEMVKRFKLDVNKKYKHLSFGMRTMLTTILTLANTSKVVLLDEPVLGFDPLMRDQFNQLLVESINEFPRIIIVSTHLVDEIAKICEHLILINDAKISFNTSIADIDENAYVLTGPKEEVEKLIKDLNCINKAVIGPMLRVHVYDKRVKVPQTVTLERMSLQDFFINYVGGQNNV